MSNKIIYPLLIIIFSILIIYGIINIKNNSKLNNSIESYQNNFINNSFNKSFNKVFKSDIHDNTFITKDFANGSWTIPESIVNNNYTITNLMNININKDITINPNDYVGFSQNSINFGTIDYNGDIYNINYVLNENITAVSSKYKQNNMHIKLFNKFNSEGSILINEPYYTPETLNAVVSIFDNNLLITKFASYKVYNGKVGGEVYRIIKSKDIYIDQAPPLFDYATYEVLMNNYKYPDSDTLYTSSDMTYVNNSSKYNKIISIFPTGKLLISVQRVFYSPTGTTIKTKASDPYLMSITSGNNNILSSFIICPFSVDKQVNNLVKFFEPKETILYFYTLDQTNSSYSYSNPDIQIPISGLKLQNGAENMYGYSNYLLVNDLTSVQQVSSNTYMMTSAGSYSPNSDPLTSYTTIPFDDILNQI